MRVCPPSAIGKWRIGRGQLDRRHLIGTQRQGTVHAQRAFHSQTAGQPGHVAAPGFLGDLHGDRIRRAGKGLAQCHPAAIGIVVILRLPITDTHRRVIAHIVRGEARLECRGIDEGLEGRARLAPGQDGPVELGAGIAATADHGPHRTVKRHRDQCGFAGAGMGLVIVQNGRHSRFRRPLGIDVQRRAHDQVLLMKSGQFAHIVGYPVDEILGPLAGCPARDPDRGARGCNALVLADPAGLGHQVEDHRCPGRCPLGVVDGAVA